MKLTPRMREGLALLVTGDPLAYDSGHCIGLPTKQRLAKYGLARYTPYVCVAGEQRWDGPMVITEEGKLALCTGRT